MVELAREALQTSVTIRPSCSAPPADQIDEGVARLAALIADVPA
jgi:hypothetical protein